MSKDWDYDVFISHASDDTPWCEKLVERLTSFQLKVWFDKSKMRGAGGDLAGAINEGLAKSRRVVVVMTPAYFAKDWTLAEASFAVSKDPSGRRRLVVPILLKDCSIPPLLSSIGYSDFRDEARFDENCHRLADILRGTYPEAVSTTLHENRLSDATQAPAFLYKPKKGRSNAETNDEPGIVIEPPSAHDPLEQVREKLNHLVQPEEGQRWLYAPQAIFDGRRPIDLINQGESDRVMQILIRLEEGIHI